MRINLLYTQCGREEESINHVLFTCHFATTIWRLSNSPVLQLHHFSSDAEDNIQRILNLNQNQDISDVQKLLPLWLLGHIWKGRNIFVFNRFRESPSKIVLKAQAETKNWINITSNHKNKASSSSKGPSKKTTWTPSTYTAVKCNFDAGFDVQTLQATGG